MKELYTGGQLVVKIMEEFGVKVVFGVPGGQTLYVTDPIQDTGNLPGDNRPGCNEPDYGFGRGAQGLQPGDRSGISE